MKRLNENKLRKVIRKTLMEILDMNGDVNIAGVGIAGGGGSAPSGELEESTDDYYNPDGSLSIGDESMDTPDYTPEITSYLDAQEGDDDDFGPAEWNDGWGEDQIVDRMAMDSSELYESVKRAVNKSFKKILK